MSARPRVIGVIGHVLLLLAMLVMLGVGYLFYRSHVLFDVDSRWLKAMPSEGLFELTAEILGERIKRELLAPPHPDEPRVTVIVDADDPDFPPLFPKELADSVRARLPRLDKALADTSLPDAVLYPDYLVFETFEGAEWFTYTGTAGTRGNLHYRIAVAPKHHVVNTLIPRVVDTFLNRAPAGGTLRALYERGMVEVRIEPRKEDGDTLVLLEMPPQQKQRFTEEELIRGQTSLNAMGNLVIEGLTIDRLGPQFLRSMGYVLLSIWVIVLAGILWLMSRIRTLSRS